MKHLKIPIGILGLALVALTQPVKGEEAQIKKWQKILSEKDVPQIATTLKNGEYEWPYIGSPAKSPDEQVLAQFLSEKLRSNDFVELPIEKLIPTCEALSQELVKSGGYANVLLAETAQRILIGQSINELINSPEQYSKVGSLIGNTSFPENLTSLAKTLSEEKGEFDFQEEIVSGDMKPLLKKVRENLNINDQEYLLLMATHDSQTTDLLNNTDMRKLLGRMIVTEVNGTSLLALVEYLKKGGELDNLTHYMQNYIEFKDLMGDSIKRSDLRLWPIKKVGPREIQGLIESEAVEHYLSVSVTRSTLGQLRSDLS